MPVTRSFDNESEEILKPTDIIGKTDGFPETAVVMFSEKTMNAILNNYPSEQIDTVSAGYSIKIYKTEYKNKPVAFYMSLIGAPAAVGILEKILAKGCKKILLFGSCGSLDNNISDGHIVVPTSAYRDEGTSYHYVPADYGDYIEIKSAGKTYEILTELNVPAIRGKTWTTDAIYRETKLNMERRKRDGCVTVEMECAFETAIRL